MMLNSAFECKNYDFEMTPVNKDKSQKFPCLRPTLLKRDSRVVLCIFELET